MSIDFAKLLASCAALAAVTATAAGAAPLVPSRAGHTVEAPGLTQVHYRRHYHRHRGVIVDAPFTYVETRRYDPYYYPRRGVHVRAPFVSVWVPR